MDRSHRRLRDDEPEPRQPSPIYALQETEQGDIANCQICGEDADGEMGEFALPEPITAPGVPPMISIIAHGQCGLDHGLTIA